MKNRSQTSDDQKIRNKPRPEALTRDAESRCDQSALSENLLGQVSAAGDTTIPTMCPDVLLGRHDIPSDARENKP